MADLSTLKDKATRLLIEGFFDPATSTVSYLVLDPASKDAIVIDSVLDYDPRSGRTHTASVEKLAARLDALGARLRWILETHVHADHLTAAPWLKARFGARDGTRTAIGAHITRVQDVFGDLFNAGPAFAHDGSQFDRLLADGEGLEVGKLSMQAMHTPGHTPACMTYVFNAAPDQSGTGLAAFVGDTLFMPDYGSARCDFPGGDARILYRSIRRVLALPPDTRLHLCHDYPPDTREPAWVTTVADQRASNIHVHDGISEDDFVAMREKRDATLSMPVLLLPSVQVNMRAGEFAPPESNGRRYLKIPIDAL